MQPVASTDYNECSNIWAARVAARVMEFTFNRLRVENNSSYLNKVGAFLLAF
jgi:hypothetical protein